MKPAFTQTDFAVQLAGVIRAVPYAYSSICGRSASVSSGGLRFARGSGLSLRGFRCGSGCVRGRMDGVGGSWLMLSNVPMMCLQTGYSLANVSAGEGETL